MDFCIWRHIIKFTNNINLAIQLFDIIVMITDEGIKNLPLTSLYLY